MPPGAHAIVVTDLPVRVVDLATTPAEFDFEPGGRLRIEGEHVIIGVPAECTGDRHASLESAIVCVPHVIHCDDLQHEMMDVLRHRRGCEGHRVVPWVGVEKGYAEGESGCQLGFNPIGETHAEQLAVEPFGGLRIHRPEDDVAEPLVAGDESGGHQRRSERLGRRGRGRRTAPRERRWDPPADARERYAARARDLATRLGGSEARLGETLGELLQRRFRSPPRSRRTRDRRAFPDGGRCAAPDRPSAGRDSPSARRSETDEAQDLDREALPCR